MPPIKKAAPKPVVAPKKASASALAKFEEQFAKTFGSETLDTGVGKVPEYKVISTGSLALDYELGVGGIVEGRVTECWGLDGIGKTRLALLHMVAAQEKYPTKKVAFIDVEHKFDWNWAIKHGLNRKMTYLFTPDNAEDVADAVKEFIRSGIVSVVVVDSIGAMIPEAEKEKDADAVVMAQQAKIVTRMVKIASAEAPKTGTSVFLINQVRASLAKFGADTTTSGGFALKHVTSFKFKAKKTGTESFKAKVNGQDVVVGHEVAFFVERNAVAPAYRTATAVFFNVETEKYGPVGLDKADEAVTMGIKTKVIKQRGGWYDLPDGTSHNGRGSVVDYLRASADALDKVRAGVLDIAAGRVLMEESAPEDIPEVDDPEAAIDPRFRGEDAAPKKGLRGISSLEGDEPAEMPEVAFVTKRDSYRNLTNRLVALEAAMPPLSKDAPMTESTMLSQATAPQPPVPWVFAGEPPIMGVPHSLSTYYMALPVNVIPELAQHWLDQHNINNRKVYDNRVEDYYNDMVGGTWRADGNTVAFDTNWRMINGQHRCLSVIRYGKPVTMLVAVNCDPMGFATTDTGKVRTGRDVLTIAHSDKSYLQEAAPLGRLIYNLLNRQNDKTSVTHTQLLDIYEQYGDSMKVACEVAARGHHIVRGNRTTLALAYWLIAQRDARAAHEFFQAWIEQAAPQPEDNPAWAIFRAWTTGSHVRRDNIPRSALIIKAYNAWVEGRTYKHLIWRRDEKFPVPLVKYGSR